MGTLIVFSLLIILFEFAVLRWGVDSRDGLDSSEWVRRLHRGNFI